VLDLSVAEGAIVATVRGSEGDQYEVSIGTMPAPAGVRRQVLERTDGDDAGDSGVPDVDGMIGDGIEICPRESDLAFSCDCADWDEFCKHVVAVLMALADRVDLDQTLLLRWRSIDVTPTAPVEPSSPDSTSPESAGSGGWRLASRRVAGADGTPSGEPADESGDRPESNLGAGDGDAGPQSAEDRKARLTELEALLGDTAVRVEPGRDPAPAEPPTPPVISPTMAEFLGLGLEPPTIDLAAIATPDPLFADFQLGPLADLGPALAEALAIVSERLADQA